MSELLGVTLEELVGSLKRRRAPLPFEIGTFVALETCEALASGPARVRPTDVRIATDGTISIFAPPNSASSEDAAKAVISLLAFLLVAAGPGVPPGLLGLVERGPGGGYTLHRLRDDLEATLVPLNRSAARRVLSRMLREAQRETGSRAALPAPGGIPPTAQVDAALDDLLGPGGSPSVLSAPAASKTLRTEGSGEFYDRPTAPRGVQAPPVSAGQVELFDSQDSEDMLTTQPVAPPTVDSVAALLDGLSSVPPPPSGGRPVVRTAVGMGIPAPIASKPLPVPQAALPPLKPSSVPPPPPPKPSSIPPPSPHGGRSVDFPGTPRLPSSGGPAQAATRPPPGGRRIEPLASKLEPDSEPPPARAPRAAKGPVAALEPEEETSAAKPRRGGGAGSGDVGPLLRPAPVTLSSMDSLDVPRRTGRGLIVFVVLVVLAAGLAALVFYLRPDALARLRGERAPEEIEAERRQQETTARHERERAAHARLFGELLVRASPDRAQVLLYIGRGPAEQKNLPVGVAHEFVAMVDGRAPTRAIVPADADWETTPQGSRFELAMQVSEQPMPLEQLDFGATRLPRGAMGTPGATLGTVRVVTAPRGAKVYQLIGFTPDVRVSDLRTDEAVELIIFAPGFRIERVVVGPSDWREVDGHRVAEVAPALVEIDPDARQR